MGMSNILLNFSLAHPIAFDLRSNLDLIFILITSIWLSELELYLMKVIVEACR
jgi:hypothetical protein